MMSGYLQNIKYHAKGQAASGASFCLFIVKVAVQKLESVDASQLTHLGK